MLSLELIILIAVIVGAIAVIWAWLGSGAKFFERQKPEAENTPSVEEVLEGYRQLAAGNNDEGIELLKQAALGGYKDPALYITLSTLYRTTGRMDKAVKMCESLLMRRSTDIIIAKVVLEELIENYRISGSMHNAEECIKNLEARKISLPELILLKADLDQSKGEYEAAIKKYQRYEKDTDIPTFREVANCYVRMGENDLSSARVKCFQNALKSDPKSFEASMMLAESYFKEDKDTQGLETLSKMVKAEIIMSKEALQKVEDLYYKYVSFADLYELMSRQTVAGVADPMPYLFLSSYHVKKGENENAAAILKEYLSTQEPLAVVTKQYAQLTSDNILRRVVGAEKLYACEACGHELDDYTRICPKCGGLDSLKFK
jgi:lipopolysaccharide biosynthesis regulator YciM